MTTSERQTREPGRFLTLWQVHEATGLSPRTVTRRIQRGVVPTFADLLDRRKTLVAEGDVPLLIEPYPVSRTPEGRQLQPA